MRTCIGAVLISLLNFASPVCVVADATADVAPGRELIAAGDFEKGLALLTATAQNLPQAVEPQLALAEAYLKLGENEKALSHFRKVLTLSPEHAQAKRIVEALTGRRQAVAERLELAKTFVAIGAFKPAETALRQAMADAADSDERDNVRAMLAQSLLWSGNTAAALDEAGRLMLSARRAAEGRVLAALALLGQQEPDMERAGTLLAGVEPPNEAETAWSAWFEVAKLQIQLHRGEDPAGVAGEFGKPISTVPAGPFRQTIVSRAATLLIAKAREQIGRGKPDGAASILWPLVSGDKLPDVEQPLSTIELNGGWLDRTAAAGPLWLQLSQVYSQIGKADHERHGANAKLLAYWLAAEVARQAPTNVNRVEHLLHIVRELAAHSGAADNRKLGTVLSRADELQFAILQQALPLATDENQRMAIVDLVAAQVARYQQVEDVETGLNQIVPPALFSEIKRGERVQLTPPFNAIPVGPAHQKLLNFLADRFAELGNKAFHDAKNSLAQNANEALQPYDRIAIHLYGELAAAYPSATNSIPAIEAIIGRYSSARKWIAASEATIRFYAQLSGNAGRWAAIRLRVAQAQDVESELLAAQRRLPNELPPLVVEALAETIKIATENRGKPTWRAAVQLVEPLVNRYAELDRYDLAAAVIATMGDKHDNAPLADWAAWAQIQLVDRQAVRAIAIANPGLDFRTKLPLNEFHERELALLGEFVTKFRQSEYIAAAAERVIQIAGVYQSHRSFDVARQVLAEFVKAHSTLEFAPRIELQVAQIAVAKARAAFDDRKDKIKPPAELSAEFEAAIDALATFLKAHPRGAFARTAENEMLQIARTYGEVGAWPVTRDVIERFAEAVPDFRSPAQLQLLRAATYLGELDRGYGLAILQPSAPAQASTPADNAIAMKSAGGFEPANRLAVADEKAASRAVGQPRPGEEFGEFSGRSIGGGGVHADAPAGVSRPSVDDLALAKVRQSQHEHLASIAMLETNNAQVQSDRTNERDVALPSGPVLSAAAMKQQDDASDKAYEILVKLAADADPSNAATAQHARAHIHWVFGFFEGQLRPERAVVLIRRYVSDRPHEPARVSLAYRVLTNLISYAAMQQPTDRIDKAWIDQRHDRFEQARAEIEQFLDEYSDRRDWVEHAQILRIDSFDREAHLVAQVSPIRAAGLLLQSADALTDLFRDSPDHPAIVNFPERLWNLAERLVSLDQQEQAIHVLSQIPMFFPTHARAHQAVLRQAELYAANLRNPLRAVETYLEHLGLAGDNESIRTQIYTIGNQLAAAQRYLEAIHVYSAFVDSFPTDPRAAQALLQIGQTHQSNQAWEDAMLAYARIVAEYPAAPIAPQVKLALAECHINLSQWRSARTLYEEFVQQFSGDPQAEMARTRIDVLKNLDRYQTLVADDAVQRNKDDAQFQIGAIVLEKLANPVKAVTEFRKVVANYPKSPQADDAQLEIGKALLSLVQLVEARDELLKVAQNYPGSPLADDALYLIGQSYERDAQRLAAVTSQKARADAFERQQRGAYAQFNEDQRKKDAAFTIERDMLKREGRKEELDLSEAAQAFRSGSANLDTLSVTARQAAITAETESALQVANRQDRINEAYRRAVEMYARSSADYPLGDMTDDALLRMAEIFETELKDRVAAMEAYQKIVKVFPGTPVAEDAAWKVAQFHEREGKHQQAVDAYRDFIRSYPASARVADAQFAMAEALEQLGRWVEAMDAYETFRQKFTAHPKTQLALEQINWIKAYRK